MQTSSPPKKDARSDPSVASTDDASNELKFISELGRSLLFTVHPKKVASRVAEAIQQGVDARVCVFVAELDSIGLICCAIGATGEIEESLLRRDRFEKWLAFMPPQVGYTESSAAEFMIDGIDHDHEYVSPLHINGEIRGAII